jgi:hypothetical protein
MNPKPLEIAEVQCRLHLGPRHRDPITDDAVLTVGYHSGNDKSVLLTRARAAELRDWLNVWLEHGWEGVPQRDGESTADVIDRFRAIAVRKGVELDQARSQFHRDLDAALALIPAESRTVDLAEVAAEQSRHWHRIQAENAGLERFRLAIIQALFDLEGALGPKEPALQHLRKVVDKYNHPKVDDAKLPTTDAPIYDARQMDLFELEDAA